MNYTYEIVQDPDPIDPREWDNLGIMICFHKRYQLGDKHPYHSSNFEGWQDVYNHLKKELKALVILPLFLYDHSGLTMSTSETYPYNDRWDAGQVGFIYTTRARLDEMGLKTRLHRKIAEYLRNEVKEYDLYLRGEVYGYKITDTDGEFIDSCYGYIGRKYAEEEAQSVIKHLQEEDAKLVNIALERALSYG